MDIGKYLVWTALVTPLNPDYSIDFKGIDRLLFEQKQSNLGLLILGSTGESLNLRLDDKKRIIEHILNKTLNLPIMVGVAGHDLFACLDWLSYLESLPIDAYLMITPIYARPGDDGQYQWFKALMDNVSRPVMIYNVPKRTGAELSLNAIEHLHEHRNYWSIKDASGSVDKFKLYLEASHHKPVFCGDDALFADFANAGSAGLISVASNVWPYEVARYAELCLAGTFQDQDLWSNAFRHLFTATNPISVKRLLFEEGRIAHKTLMPPLSERDFISCDELLAISQKIKDWRRHRG